MQGQDKFDRFVRRYPHPHKPIFEKPHLNRRRFFEVLGAGLTGSYLISGARAADIVSQADVVTQNKAKNVVFILLSGAPSHVDTFDLKVVPGVTPTNLNPTTISGLLWPTGLLPKLGAHLPKMAIVRSMRSWALVHNLARHWIQIGRNPVAALGDIAPNIGSVVAIEKSKDKTASQVFPTFLALNSPAAAGPGYFPSTYAPFKVNPATTGLPNTANALGQTRADQMYSRLRVLDDPLRLNSPLGAEVQNYDPFYSSARGLMYNAAVDTAFKYSTADAARYGTTGFGNACLVAKQVLAANQGTRFIQITHGSWDHHQDIYDADNLYQLSKELDDGVGALLGDLEATGLLNETLVVMAGEFGRTVGALSAQNGRDHYLQQFCAFAGAGVRGGRAIGSTTADGSSTAEYGWSRNRDIRPEDVEATIYSALGINWTTVRYDDPFARGFEYVPYAGQDLYGPVNELWT